MWLFPCPCFCLWSWHSRCRWRIRGDKWRSSVGKRWNHTTLPENIPSLWSHHRQPRSRCRRRRWSRGCMLSLRGFEGNPNQRPLGRWLRPLNMRWPLKIMVASYFGKIGTRLSHHHFRVSQAFTRYIEFHWTVGVKISASSRAGRRGTVAWAITWRWSMYKMHCTFNTLSTCAHLMHAILHEQAPSEDKHKIFPDLKVLLRMNFR